MSTNGSTRWIRLRLVGTSLVGVLATVLINFYHFALRASEALVLVQAWFDAILFRWHMALIAALAVHIATQRDTAA